MKGVVGVIGVGNMGSALVKGWLRSGRVDILVWDEYRPALERLLAEGGDIASTVADTSLAAADSLERLVEAAEVIVVVVKPKDAQGLLNALGNKVRPDQTVVSAMAGLTLEWLRGALGPGPNLFRVMPNLAVELGAGAVAVAAEQGADPTSVERVLGLFGRSALTEVLPEDLFDVFTAISGSSPALLALAIEGLEDGAVAAGLGRADARRVVREAALQTVSLLGDHSDSPEALGRALIESGEVSAGTAELMKQKSLDLAFRDAVAAAMERSRQMGKA